MPPYPPDTRRRRKLCRIWVLAAVCLAGACVSAGFSYWQETRFPARTVHLADLPVELRVQDGVQRRDLSAVTQGLRLADRYMRSQLRRTVRHHVEARVAHRNGCRPFESSSSDSIGEADPGFLCVATRNLHWQWLVKKDRPAAIAVSAHEYVHVLQSELGCLDDGTPPRFRWLVEGMAEELAWRALISSGRVSNARILRTIRADALPAYGLIGRGLYPLAAYERADGADREYALWHLAVRHLLHAAVNEGAAPRARPDISLRRFCERAGVGTGWRQAFERSFGLPLGRFYRQFERFRARAGNS
jgi:hypothetical protein